MKTIKKIFFITILTFFFISPLFSCNSKKEVNDIKMNREISFKQVTAKEAKELMDSLTNFVILDVRSEEEYNEYHIKNAILIPDYEIIEKAERILKDKNQTIFVYCRSGRRSKAASKNLTKLGYKNIIEFGGVNNWPYGFVSE